MHTMKDTVTHITQGITATLVGAAMIVFGLAMAIIVSYNDGSLLFLFGA